MAFVTKEEISRDIINQTGAQTSLMKPNLPIRDEILPVIVMNTTSQILKWGSAINSTSGTIYTLPTDKDFYLTGATLGMLKDATATSILTNLTCRDSVGNVASTLLAIPGLTLTAQSGNASITLAHPLKLMRGSAITVANSTSVGNVSAYGTITGFFL